MAHVGTQLAPGIGELMPGTFVLPQNPLRQLFGVPERVPHIGDLLPGKFAVPENPLVRALSESAPGCGCRRGLGCPCHLLGLGLGEYYGPASSGTSGMSGLGFLESIPWGTLALAGGGLLLLFFFMSRGGDKEAYKFEAKRIKGIYAAGMRKLGEKYPRFAGRARRAVKGAKAGWSGETE